MSQQRLARLRSSVRRDYLVSEKKAVEQAIQIANLTQSERDSIAARGADLVATVRSSTTPSLMEAFLAEYGLSTKEGLALMCLAEALLRVPDAATMDALIEDKVLGGGWGDHAGQSISSLVNASTLGLRVTSAILREGEGGVSATLKGLVKRVGLPVIRRAVKQVMKELGRQFVLGQDIAEAQDVAEDSENDGYSFSYDMLGEAAHTAMDAEKYFGAYADAIGNLSDSCNGTVQENPGISIKLSALHPRYEQYQQERVMDELVPRVLRLAEMASTANMGLNIDAEEADRLDLSLDVIEAVLSSETLAGWDGFGVVVQAYGKRAHRVLDWLYALSQKLDRKIMVRLVKGAYWDAELKRAQVMGLDGFPVFTMKEHSDIAYIACARKLFEMRDRIYPQFATHNAHTVAAVLHYSTGIERNSFEFQRLHGMGESLHSVLHAAENTNCRIYAPVGAHRDLLAYLVRRLLENGANSSFVNQIIDNDIPPTVVAADPFALAAKSGPAPAAMPADLFGPARKNSRGWDGTNRSEMAAIDEKRDAFSDREWSACAVIKGKAKGSAPRDVINPASSADKVGSVADAAISDVDTAFKAAEKLQPRWAKLGVEERAACLDTTADLFEKNAYEFFAILTREAGKSLDDGIAEVREAVDFLRFYAQEMRHREERSDTARGTFVCISPWNFPLAIFTGQIAAALVAGNCVIAKPAEQTTLVAMRAVELMIEAGIPEGVIQLLPGDGATIGAALTSDARLAGVCFTGSTDTAMLINRAMAETCDPAAPLVAETGGLNAMLVDSTALPEQAIRDIIASSFQSAGQRCSALRMLYIQEDVAEDFISMLMGAMDELSVGNPWLLSTDVGPVIDREAQDGIQAYCKMMDQAGRLIHKLDHPDEGRFVSPALYRVKGIEDLDREIFGPILHVATYTAEQLDSVIDAVNGRGYGLTMGLHTRIDERVEDITGRIHVGNLYVNRNQIGAIVGCQPFGGEGLSGTGPKAGGPHYLDAFLMRGEQSLKDAASAVSDAADKVISARALNGSIKRLKAMAVSDLEDIRLGLSDQLRGLFPAQSDLIEDCISQMEAEHHDILEMPSPVGETNILRSVARGTILIVSDAVDDILSRLIQALYTGNKVLICAKDITGLKPLEALYPIQILAGHPAPAQYEKISDIDVVSINDQGNVMRGIRRKIAKRKGVIIPLVCEVWAPYRYVLERHCCTDTTASGGDAALLGGIEPQENSKLFNER